MSPGARGLGYGSRPLGRPGDGQEADLSGALVAGSSADCIEEMQKFADRRVGCVVLDFRLRMGEFEDSVRRIGEEALPVV